MNIDPVEIFGSALVAAFQRVFTFLACLYLGSFLGFLGEASFLTCKELLKSYFTSFPELNFWPELILLPFWSIGTLFSLLALPNIMLAAIYYFRTEEPSRLRFIQFTTIHHLAFIGASCETYWYEFSRLEMGLFLCVQLLAWGAFFYFLSLIKIKQSLNHEEHLLTVAAENAVWRHRIENLEHIPPPPSGPRPPNPRPL